MSSKTEEVRLEGMPSRMGRLILFLAEARFFSMSLVIHVAIFLLFGALLLVKKTGKEGGPENDSGMCLMQSASSTTALPDSDHFVQRTDVQQPPVLLVNTEGDFQLNNRIRTGEISSEAFSALTEMSFDKHGDGFLSRGNGDNRVIGDGGIGKEIKFFGIKSKGQRIAILVDVSGSMVAPSKGGYEGYARIKEELTRVVNDFSEAHFFNLILFGGEACVFSPDGLLQADAKSKQDFSIWIKSLYDVSQVRTVWSPDMNRPVSIYNLKDQPEYHSHKYEPTMAGLPEGGGTRIDLALLAAFEQGVDTILVLSDGEPNVMGWKSQDVLKKVEEWQKKFYTRKGVLKPPCISVVSYEADPAGITFLQNLARFNRGEFRSIKGFHSANEAPVHVKTQGMSVLGFPKQPSSSVQVLK